MKIPSFVRRKTALICFLACALLPAAAFASADLAITAHSHDPASPAVGDDINYFFTVHNNGPDAATNVVLHIDAFNGQVYQGSAAPYPFVDNGNGFYTASIGSLGAGSDASFRISFHVTEVSAIYAFLEADCDNDSDTSNDTAEEDAQVSGGATADLVMASVTVAPNPAGVGDLRHYQGTVTNNGPDEATDVAVAIQADSQDSGGFGFDQFEIFDHSIPPPNPPNADANGIRYIPVGNIPAHASVGFDVFYNAVKEGSFTRNFFMSLSGAETDPDLTNNHFVVSSTIGASTASADLDPTVNAPGTAVVGSNITYSFNTFNLGPNTASNAVTEFKPDPKETFVSASVPFTIETSGPSAGYYVVNDGDLPLNVGHSFTFVFQPTASGTLTLTGDAYSDTADQNSANNNFSRAVTVANPTPPPHGGLAPTFFTVDGSAASTSGLADTVLRFAALQTSNAAALYVRVQYNTVSGHPASAWHDLDDGNHGFMAYNPATKTYFLSSLAYPAVKGVSFRAVSDAPGYDPTNSDPIGDFNLVSSKPRLTPPTFNVTGNGPFSDLFFRAAQDVAMSGATLRVQRSSTPFDELSWGDIADSTMLPTDNDPTRYYLMANKLAAGTGVYFRVLESETGFADGISKASGPFTLIADTPPKINSITVSKAISGGGTSQLDPIIVSAGSFTISATATPATGHQVAQMSLLYDGGTLNHVAGSSISQTYTTNVIGDHTVEAIAVDELGGTSRFGTFPTYVRVVPSVSALHGERAAGSSTEDATTPSAKVYTLVTSNGLWSSASTWKDGQGNNGVPGPNDLAVIKNSMTVKLSQNTTVKSISLDGQIYNTKDIPAPQVTLTVTGVMTVSTHGADILNVHLIIDNGATCEFLNNEVDCNVTGSVENDGKFILHGSKGIFGLQAFVNNGTSNFQMPLALPADAGRQTESDIRDIVTTTATSAGLIQSNLLTHYLADGSALIGQDGNGLIGQDGNGLIGQDGNGLTADGAKVISNDGGTLVNTNGSNIVGENGSGIVGQGGGNIVGQGGGNIVAQGGGNHQLQGIHAETVAAGFFQVGGETQLDGVRITGPVTLNGGVLSGSGVIDGNLTNNGGYITPGHSAGAITVSGDFTQGANGTMVLEDGGAAPNLFDRLQVGGNAVLGGTLDLKLINGYSPNKTDTFSPLGYSSAAGKFAAVSSNATVAVNNDGILTTVDSAKPTPKSGQAVNISTRAQVLTGDNVLIGGFIVSGPSGSTKQVILRGIGPSLASAGIVGALADPYLELHSATSVVASDDNWKENQAAVEATGLAPTNDAESAIVQTLTPGAYTVVMRGAHGETGVGLVEIYDLDTSSAATLANISTRCKVETGEDVMIGGFILQGTEPADVLVRGIGPSLASAGVSGVLADPVLELHDANGAVITDNDWRESEEAGIAATTIPPTDDREAAIRMTLAPGAYTAIMRGNDDGTGVALVEVYHLD